MKQAEFDALEEWDLVQHSLVNNPVVYERFQGEGDHVKLSSALPLHVLDSFLVAKICTDHVAN